MIGTLLRRDDGWPQMARPLFPSILPAGTVVTVRTPLGVRRLQVRVTRESEGGPLRRQRRRRLFLIGHDRHGLCHHAWTDDIIARRPA